jgi:hypothetical protein
MLAAPDNIISVSADPFAAMEQRRPYPPVAAARLPIDQNSGPGACERHSSHPLSASPIF